MQLIVPMSGFGERFRKAGYNVPKPLISVGGMPFFKHVVDLFPGASSVHLILNREHFESSEYGYFEAINKFTPSANIHLIEPHHSGPVFAVAQIFDKLDSELECIVAYCDFCMIWNFDDFSEFCSENDLDGAIPSYSGFHPHSLRDTNYAYSLVKDDLVRDVREKSSFSDRPTTEPASAGVYYFRSGALMRSAFEIALESEVRVNGEFYVSMVYPELISQGKKVKIYEIPFFMQWGTPLDLQDFNRWFDLFEALQQAKFSKPKDHGGRLGYQVIPAAGQGKRFRDEGFVKPKPFIDVLGQPMIIRAAETLPECEKSVIIIRSDLLNSDSSVVKEIESAKPNVQIELVDGLTEGQAHTAFMGYETLPDDRNSRPITFSVCDSGFIFEENQLHNEINDGSGDLLVWSAMPSSTMLFRPEMYGWIEVNDQNGILEVKVKQPTSNIEKSRIIVGAFTFRTGRIFETCYGELIKRDVRVNNELYMDSLVSIAKELGYSVKSFPVEHYICWGTPEEYKVFNYWNSCFTQWTGSSWTGPL